MDRCITRAKPALKNIACGSFQEVIMNKAVKCFSPLVVAAMISMLSSIALAASPAFKFFDVPGAADTTASGINDAGQIVGTFNDEHMPWFANSFGLTGCDGCQHGFLYSKGKFTTIDFPGAKDTRVTAINNFGDMVGTYSNASGSYGFIYASGKFTTVPVFPGSINNTGQILGGDGIYHNGHITTLHLPGGGTDFPDGDITLASDINDHGDLTGSVSTDSSAYLYTDCGDDRAPCEAFSYINGRFNILDPHEAKVAFGINNAGDIVGYGTRGKGFLYSHGKFSTVDGLPADINNVEQVVGSFDTSTTSPDGLVDFFGQVVHTHGFLFTIPEPTLLALLVGGFVGFAWRERFREKH